MRRLAIIPARGGSKRIPRKNIKTFLGKPIIAYAIEVALNAGLFDEVMVSTDDPDIAEVALQYGASVPFLRSKEAASDSAQTVDALLEVIEQYELRNTFFDKICCIYPSAPFITVELLHHALQHLKMHQLDTVFPVLRFGYPIQRAIVIRDQKVQMLFPENENARSQDLEQTFHDCGQFYWMQVKALKEHRKIWTSNTGAIVLDEMNAHDIDNEEDWKIAEFKYTFNHETKSIL